MKIIRAQWILPITRPPIHDGAIAIKQGKIYKVGSTSEIIKEIKAPLHDLGSSIFLPGLVNAHTHLEYSCLKDRIPAQKRFQDWICKMVDIKKTLKEKEILRGMLKGVRDLKDSGTLLVGEITNTGLSAQALGNAGLAGVIFYELVGQSRFEDFIHIKSRLRKEAPSFQISPACHAPHSVPPFLLDQLVQYLKKSRHLTSMHIAESKEEVEWIKNKKGPFSNLIHKKELLENSNFGRGWNPMGYLKKKKLLSRRLLGVHGVYLNLADIKKIRQARSFLCICPRSNQYTGTGKAPIKKFLNHQIPLCLGTDSLASNEDLNLWNEMRALKKFFPFLPYPFILRMATLNGARALGFGQTHGSIERGKKACLIYIKTGSKRILDPYKYLIEENHEELTHLWPNDSFQS
jgi:cytosine/adenosine deaminase-related metal-dependent hydrolase